MRDPVPARRRSILVTPVGLALTGALAGAAGLPGLGGVTVAWLAAASPVLMAVPVAVFLAALALARRVSGLPAIALALLAWLIGTGLVVWLLVGAVAVVLPDGMPVEPMVVGGAAVMVLVSAAVAVVVGRIAQRPAP